MSKWRPDEMVSFKEWSSDLSSFRDFSRNYAGHLALDMKPLTLEDAYKAGADALLKALKKTGKYWSYKANLMEDKFGLHPVAIPIVDIKNKKGWLVFIPDGEEVVK